MRPPLRAAKLFQACDSFEDAAQLVSELLRQYVGVRRWYALRRIGSHWSAVDTRDLTRLDARDAQVFADSMLAALSEATGPLLVAHIRDFTPASGVTAENAGAAYLIGAPLIQRRRLDGFVCGLTDAVPYAEIRRNRSLIQASIRLLNTLLEFDVQARTLRRWAERAREQTLIDPLTTLLNRRGWDQFVQKEESRAHRYGRAATLFVIDLDGFKDLVARSGHAAGDKILRAAAAALSRATRANDLVARLGGDEFGVLAVESDEETGAKLYRRLADVLESDGVSASIGMAQMGELSAAEALRAADRAMDVAKRRRAGGER